MNPQHRAYPAMRRPAAHLRKLLAHCVRLRIRQEALHDHISAVFRHLLQEKAHLLMLSPRHTGGNDAAVFAFQHGLDVENTRYRQLHVAQPSASSERHHIVHRENRLDICAFLAEPCRRLPNFQSRIQQLPRTAYEIIQSRAGIERIHHFDALAARLAGGHVRVGIGAAQAGGDGQAKYVASVGEKIVEHAHKRAHRRLGGMHPADILRDQRFILAVRIHKILGIQTAALHAVGHRNNPDAQRCGFGPGQIDAAVHNDGCHSVSPPIFLYFS